MSKDLNYSLNLDSFKVLGNDELQKLKGGRCSENCKKSCSESCSLTAKPGDTPGPAGTPSAV